MIISCCLIDAYARSRAPRRRDCRGAAARAYTPPHLRSADDASLRCRDHAAEFQMPRRLRTLRPSSPALHAVFDFASMLMPSSTLPPDLRHDFTPFSDFLHFFPPPAERAPLTRYFALLLPPYFITLLIRLHFFQMPLRAACCFAFPLITLRLPPWRAITLLRQLLISRPASSLSLPVVHFIRYFDDISFFIISPPPFSFAAYDFHYSFPECRRALFSRACDIFTLPPDLIRRFHFAHSAVEASSLRRLPPLAALRLL